MVTLADVRRWDPAAVEAAFTVLGQARDRVRGLDDTMRTGRTSPEDWQGTAGDAARAGHDVAAAHLRRLGDGMDAARPAVADAADGIAGLRSALSYVDTLAGATGFSIGADGMVDDVLDPIVPVDQVAFVRAARTAARTTIVNALQGILDRAATIDMTLHDTLTQIAAAHAELIAPAGGPDGPTPHGATPEQTAAWWRNLSPDQQTALLRDHPEALGNRDGIPAAVRDQANRAQLPLQLARADDELAAANAALADVRSRTPDTLRGPVGGPLPQGPTLPQSPDEIRLQAQVFQLRERRAALIAIQRTVDRPDRQLLLLDVDGHASPRAAVAVGDVDTADHVAVFTPGFTTTVRGGLQPTVNQLADLNTVARQRLVQTGHPGQTSATVAWVGYDVPQWDTTFSSDDSVLDPAAAQRGGVDLADFDDGVLASRAADPNGHRPHFTALGHSYGSTTTGQALTHTREHIDDAVVFGSPGLGIVNPSDLHLPANHVDVIAAPGDVIAISGRYGGDPSVIPGVNTETAMPSISGDGVALRGSSGHSQYLDQGTTSQYEIANTIAGTPDPGLRVVPDPPQVPVGIPR